MIAILGATGTIGLSLAHKLSADPRGLTLFARRPHRLVGERFASPVLIRSLGEFAAADFELVINAIGAGDPGRVASMGTEIIDITAFWDHRVLNTMNAHTRYVFLSSGAVSGVKLGRWDHQDPALNRTESTAAPPYVRAKLDAELRHRRSRERRILDLRVFGYADVTLPRQGRFFLCELAESVRTGVLFRTSSADMVRDYAGREELAALIDCWERGGADNNFLDLYAREPARKRDILQMAREQFGVKIQYSADVVESTTGSSQIYASQNHSAAVLGYRPQRSSLEVVADYLSRVAGSLSDSNAAS
jgi:nucleoside-diphosphate-sugar epimerase